MKSHLTAAQLADFGLSAQQLALVQAEHAHLVATHLRGEHSDVIGVGITTNPEPTCQNDLLAFVLLLKKAHRHVATLYGDRTAHGWKILHRVVGEIVPLPHAEMVAGYRAAEQQLGQGFDDTYRPVYGGVSVSATRAGVWTGTIGCQVEADNHTYMLSNSHILGPVGNVQPGDVISQPGTADGGSTHTAVGTASVAVPLLPLTSGTAPVNTVDAAIALYESGIASDTALRKTVSSTYNLSAPIVPAVVTDRVQKSGRTTGYTTGAITTVGVTIDVGPYPDGSHYRFSGVFEARTGSSAPFAQAGDSGAVVSTLDGNHPVGLLFAGSDDGTAFVIPMQVVLDELTAANGGSEVTIKY